MISVAPVIPQQNRFALLLIGAPKSGKTNLAFQFPRPKFIDCDMNLESALRRQPSKQYQRLLVDFDEQGNEVALDMRWPRLLALVNKDWNSDTYDTLVIDSMTKIRNYLQDYLLSRTTATKDLVIGGEKMMTINHWGPYAVLMQRFVSGLRKIPKYVIVTAHLHSEKDETDGKWLFKPAIGGQSEDTLAGIFTDLWCCEAQPASGGVKYTVRTVPSARIVLGNTLNLPESYTFSWDDFKKRMDVFK